MDQNPGKDFQSLKNFLESKEASQKAISCLKKGVEIQIVLEPETICAYFGDNGSPRLENRVANNPDVEFRISKIALENLLSKDGSDMGEFGIDVVKEFLRGEVKIKVLGGALSMLKNGYINIIKDAGPSFFKFITENGLSSLAKLPEIFKKMRS